MSTKKIKPCDVSCPKCGSLDIHMCYHAKGQDTNRGSYSTTTPWVRSSEFVNREGKYVQPALQDCIISYCRCCGHIWDGPTLDVGE
jgi:hypothetical protein